MTKFRFFLVLLLIFAVATSVFAQDEIDVGDSVDGEQSSDAAEYELFLEEGQSVAISVVSDDFDTYLELYNEDGDQIATNDDAAAVGGFNSQIVYTAEDSAPVVIHVRAFGSDGPDGDYTLTVEEVEITTTLNGGELVYDEEVSAEPDGALEVVFTFEASEGDVVNIIVLSDGEDTRLSLLDPDDDEIATDDDGGESFNPVLRRFELADDGTYTLVITQYSGSALFEDIDVLIEQTELLSLNDGAQTVTLSDEITSDVMSFDTERRTNYIVTVTLSEASDSSLYVRFTEEDEFYANTNMSFSGMQVVSFVFEADETGRADVELEFYGYSEEIDVTVEVEALD